jgi:hypothetical protein
MELSQR